MSSRQVSKIHLVAVVNFMLLGALIAFGAERGLEYSNSTSFCISCHEMKSTVYVEYQESYHFRNHAGVQAQCADCHVPKDFGPKIVRKILAVNDLYHHLLGSIDSKEKFESKRAALAKKVWLYMEASDSRECRSCHSWTAMELEEQDRRAKRKHVKAQQEGSTCIDCHKGVAHELPLEFGGV